MSISSEVEENIGRILQDVRRASSASETSQSSFGNSRSYSETGQASRSGFGSSRSYSETGQTSRSGFGSSRSYSETGQTSQSGFGSSRSYSETGQTDRSGFANSKGYSDSGQTYTKNYTDTSLSSQASTSFSSTSLTACHDYPKTSAGMDLVDGQSSTSMCVGGDVEGASCDSVKGGEGAGLWMDCSEPYAPSPVDEQLKEDLLQRQKTNSKYRKMLVSFVYQIVY